MIRQSHDNEIPYRNLVLFVIGIAGVVALAMLALTGINDIALICGMTMEADTLSVDPFHFALAHFACVICLYYLVDLKEKIIDAI